MAANTTPTILSLNDDCLFLILSKFPVQELMVLENVCIAFMRIIRMVYMTHQELDFHKITGSNGFPLPPLQARAVAQRVGLYVHTLKASRSSFSMTGRVVPKSVLMQCKNLKRIFLYDLRMTDKWCLKRLSDAFVQIKEVHLVDSNFTDEIGECLRKSSQLEVIRFTNNNEITGQCVMGLQGIKELNMTNCMMLQPQFFSSFCINNLLLRRLTIRGCNLIDTTCLYVIATKLIYLESLEIDDEIQAPPEVYLALANLPCLGSVTMYYNSITRNESAQGFLPELSMKTHSRLEELEVRSLVLTVGELNALMRFTRLRVLSLPFAKPMLDGYLLALSCKDTIEELDITGCKDVTPQGLLEFVGQCRRLRKLNISHCRQFTMDFLWQLESLLDRKLEIVARMSYYSSIACDQDELADLLECVQNTIELKYKCMFEEDEEYPHRRGLVMIPSDQIVFQ